MSLPGINSSADSQRSLGAAAATQHARAIPSHDAHLSLAHVQVPAFGKMRAQRKLSMREKVKYEMRMMTTAFSGRLPIVAANPEDAQVGRTQGCQPST